MNPRNFGSRRDQGDTGTRSVWKQGQVESHGTTKKRSDQKRREKEKTEQSLYLGRPPPGLFECRLVIPGGDQNTNGLDDPSALDVVRQKYRVWINAVKPDVLSICSESMPNLREAVGAINWALHDLRLSTENPGAKFIVQIPIYTHADGPVLVDLGARPVFEKTDAPDNVWEADVIVNDLVEKIRPGLESSMEGLRGLGKELIMRVNLGRINIRQKKVGAGREFSFPEFEQLMKTYSIRGGASLNSELADVQFVDKIIDWFLDPSVGLIHDEPDYKCTLAVVSPECELGGAVQNIHGPRPKVWLETPFLFERHPRLDWTVASPDRQFDWTFHVHAGATLDHVPNGMQTMIQNLPMSGASDHDVSFYLKFPILNKLKPGHIDRDVNEIKLKSSVLLPLTDTPYMIEISITKSWKGSEVTAPPTVSWSIEFYGMHWGETVNTVSQDGRRKDWGEDLSNIWTGPDPSLDSRLGDFLHCILRIQAALDNLAATQLSQATAHA